MYIVRSAKESDLDDLFELSKLENFLNLPNDRARLKKNISKSLDSFSSSSFNQKSTFLFCLEDLALNKVIGTSVIHAQHGTDSSPHFSLVVGKESKASTTIDKSFTHTTLKLAVDTDGPTEIGGLVLAPKYRGSEFKLGKQVAFSRFLYMAHNPHQFRTTIHAELLPPFNEDGSAPLWEAIGKKFFQMDYQKADILSRKNKEFILNLFPSENIYASLLSKQAQAAIGAVNSGTLPLMKMLKKIGFEYNNEIDPFDGGPHYRCERTSILPIKESINTHANIVESADKNFLIMSNNSPSFTCFMNPGSVNKKTLELKESELIDKYINLDKEIRVIPI